jgi:hypothetical protein
MRARFSCHKKILYHRNWMNNAIILLLYGQFCKLCINKVNKSKYFGTLTNLKDILILGKFIEPV